MPYTLAYNLGDSSDNINIVEEDYYIMTQRDFFVRCFFPSMAVEFSAILIA